VAVLGVACHAAINQQGLPWPCSWSGNEAKLDRFKEVLFHTTSRILVKTCVVGYSIHVILCFFHSRQQQLIIGYQTFWLPCSSPYQWYMPITKHNLYLLHEEDTEKKQVVGIKCYMHALPVSGAVHAMSQSYAEERFPC